MSIQEDPLIRLAKIAEEQKESLGKVGLVAADALTTNEIVVAPRRDGIFPKRIVFRMESTREIVAEGEVNKGEKFTFTPKMSGSYILDIYPKEPDDG